MHGFLFQKYINLAKGRDSMYFLHTVTAQVLILFSSTTNAGDQQYVLSTQYPSLMHSNLRTAPC